MTKSYIDPTQALALQERAAKEARERLNARGIHYPINDSSISPDENYQRLMKYSELEAHEIVKILRQPSGPRPLVVDTVKPKKTGWDGYSD